MQDVLIIDDTEINLILFSALIKKLDNCRSHNFESPLQALDWAATKQPDLVIVDYMMPGMDGLEFIQRFRALEGCEEVPILMITANDQKQVRYRALDSGANDYVVKPFNFAVLLARMRAQIRQFEQSEDAVFQLGPYTFKPAMKLLVDAKEKKIRLTEKEAAILKFLYRASQNVVARDVLLHEVWGYNSGVTTHTLETHVYRLRQKIERDPSNAEILVTENGGKVGILQAMMRYVLCWFFNLTGIAFIYSFFDKNGQFPQDRLAKTLLVSTKPRERGIEELMRHD